MVWNDLIVTLTVGFLQTRIYPQSSSRMRVIKYNWLATKQRLHPQSVAEISHSGLPVRVNTTPALSTPISCLLYRPINIGRYWSTESQPTGSKDPAGDHARQPARIKSPTAGWPQPAAHPHFVNVTRRRRRSSTLLGIASRRCLNADGMCSAGSRGRAVRCQTSRYVIAIAAKR